MVFLSTLSLRRATPRCYDHRQDLGNFYPRSPCGERLDRYGDKAIQRQISIHALLAESDCNQLLFDTLELISIHALLAESDWWSVDVPGWILGISIHALLAESDRRRLWLLAQTASFLSTLSLRRATAGRGHVAGGHQISIHALLAESDLISTKKGQVLSLFLSTLSLRRATANRLSQLSRPPAFLSTLSLRRATLNPIKPRRFHYHFYPRSPCGERR